MTSTPAPRGQPLSGALQHLRASVTGPDAGSPTVSPVERTLCWRRLTLGAALVRLCLVTRAAGRPAEPGTAPDGTRLTSHAQRPAPSDAGVGTVGFARHDGTAPGQEGCCPLEAELSVPARGSADRLREWAV
jgi:hypothetical protein